MERIIDFFIALALGSFSLIMVIIAITLIKDGESRISDETPKESICESKGLTVKTSAWHPKTNKFVIYCE